MKKTRIVASTLAAVLLVSGFSTGYAAKMKPMASKSKVSISFLNGKGEIAKQLEATAKLFNKTNKDGITLTIQSVSASSTVEETLMSKYAAGNPCTINAFGPDDYADYASKAMDLSQQAWAKKVNGNLVSNLKYKGKIIAFPYTVEGDGLIYNKTTIEKATKKKFNPSSIKSQADLEKLYKKIQAGGVTPVQISHDDWSLANHYLGTAYETQSSSTAYLNKLKAGSADIGTNKTYTGLLNLLNLNKKYNIYKSSPMSSDYNTSDPKNIATGKVAFWFNGNWVWPNVSQFLVGSHAKDQFGFLPLFADSKTSKSITAGVTGCLFVDKVKSTAAQRKAANEFLNWLVSNPTGQKQLVNSLGIIPAFNNIKISPNNGLAKSIVSYMKAKKTISFALLPGSYYTKVGAYMQQYLVGSMDKATLSKSIDSYFKSNK